MSFEEFKLPDIHYFNGSSKLTRSLNLTENREHGVGYFEFAKDEQTRQQQMETLKKLRKQV